MTGRLKTLALAAATTATLAGAGGCTTVRAGPGVESSASYASAVRECRWRVGDRRTHARYAFDHDPKVAGCLASAGWSPDGHALGEPGSAPRG
jgi:hypothetical protein